MQTKRRRLKILVYAKHKKDREVLAETLKGHEVVSYASERGHFITDEDLLKFDLLILDVDDPSPRRLLERACTYYPDNLGRLMAFVFLFGFWVNLSIKFDLFHLMLGFFCSLLIGTISYDLLFEDIRAKNRPLSILRFIGYLPWLIYQIVLANLHVAYLVLSPKMPLDPKIVNYKTKLASDIAKVTLANSITLTPGTITMDIADDEFYVHAISRKVEKDLLKGEMEQRVAHIYLEGEQCKN